MKKIPTLFERDWNGDRSRVIPQVRAGCEWVLAGEGHATRKYDGTCCLVHDNVLFKRRELKAGQEEPADFRLIGTDEETGKSIGWIPVGSGTDDKYHRLAFDASAGWPDGTYELLGPKIQGNPEGRERYELMPHSEAYRFDAVPRIFDDLRDWLTGRDIEGLVFHHPDGRMAKIKLRDFGLRRAK